MTAIKKTLVMMKSQEKSTGARFKQLKKSFPEPMTKAYRKFFSMALPLFTSYNLFRQRPDLLAHMVYPITKDLIQKIAKLFLKLEVISDLTLMKTIIISPFLRFTLD